jgi:Carboxypeptidase regulatory-like domain/TonB-dependent Receptor Plug Domain
MRCRRLWWFVLALTFPASAAAQETHGTIVGVVRDASGGVLPGVVLLARQAGGASVEATTDTLGAFRFPALAPGVYELSASLSDFASARVPDVTLGLGAQLNVDVVLQPAGPNETVEVVGRAPQVEIARNTSATSLRGEDIEMLPRGRDFTSLASRSPGANPEQKAGGLSIDGATGPENRVMIDGNETTDTIVGTPGLLLANDFIDELQVKSSGYAAEYGGSTGGVLNLMTRSGGDSFRGRLIGYLSADALDAGPRPALQLMPTDATRAETVLFPEDQYTDVTAGMTAGGPIVRAQVWFFAGYLPSRRSVERRTVFLDRVTRSIDQDLIRQDATVNVTANAGQRWRTRTAFSMASSDRRGLLPPLDGTANPTADYSVDEINPNRSISTNVDWIAGRHTLMSGRVGYFYRNSYNEGVYQGDRMVYLTSSIGLSGVPAAYQQPRLYTNVATNISRERGEGPHLNAQLSATTFLERGGQHQIKAGVQFDRVGLDVLVGATGYGVSVFWNQSFQGQRGSAGYYRVAVNDRVPGWGPVTQGRARVNNFGLFLQDAWTIGRRLTIQTGLRTEMEQVPSLSPDPTIPDVAIRFGFADKLAPRLGAAWDATGDGRTKLFGSWGIFYDITKLQLSYAFGGVSSVGYTYTLEPADIASIVDNSNCPPACPGRLIDGPRGLGALPLNHPSDNRIDPGLEQTRLREAVVGVERELGGALTASARYVRKRIDRAVEDVGTQRPGSSATMIIIGNPGWGTASSFYPGGGTDAMPLPGARRDYDAVEIGANRRMANRWSGYASYAWSRLVGNYSGLAQSDEEGRVAPNAGRNFDYPLMAFDETGAPVYGPLATAHPHRLKAGALVDAGLGLSLSAQWFAATGAPVSREAAFLPGLNVPVMYRGRVSDGRLPFTSQLDMHLQHRTHVGSRVRVTVSATVLNVFNQDAPVSYHAQELFPGQAVAVDEREFYNGVDTQALIASQGLVRDARFLQHSAFQPPRSVRLGLALDF